MGAVNGHGTHEQALEPATAEPFCPTMTEPAHFPACAQPRPVSRIRFTDDRRLQCAGGLR